MHKYTFFRLACAASLTGFFAAAPLALAVDAGEPEQSQPSAEDKKPLDVARFALSDDEIDQRCEHAANKAHCHERYEHVRDGAHRYLDLQNEAREALRRFHENNHCFGRGGSQGRAEGNTAQASGTSTAGNSGDRCRDAHHQLSSLAHRHHQQLAEAAKEASGFKGDDDNGEELQVVSLEKSGKVAASHGHHSSTGASRPTSYRRSASGHGSGGSYGSGSYGGSSYGHGSSHYEGGSHSSGGGHYSYGHDSWSDVDDFEDDFSSSMYERSRMHVEMSSYDYEEHGDYGGHGSDHDYYSSNYDFEMPKYEGSGSSGSRTSGNRYRGSGNRAGTRDTTRETTDERREGERVASGAQTGFRPAAAKANEPGTSSFANQGGTATGKASSGALGFEGALKPGTTTGSGAEYAPQRQNAGNTNSAGDAGAYQFARGSEGRSLASTPSYYGSSGGAMAAVPEFAVSSGKAAEARTPASGASERTEPVAVSQAGAGTAAWADASGNFQARSDFVNRLADSDDLRRNMARRINEAYEQGEVDAGTAQSVRGAIAEAQRRSQERRELAGLKPDAFKMDAEGTANEINRLMAKLADEPREEFLASPDEPLFRRVKGTIRRELERGLVKRPKLLN